MSKLSFGIIGAGGIASKFAEAVTLTKNASLAAVASKSPERARDFAEKNNVPVACNSYEELLARDDVNIVYIATTHNFHYDNIRMCLEAGKHVVCEKPMVLTEAHARELFCLAREKGLFLMEAMWSRFLPSITQAKAWVLAGKIGKIQSVSAVIGFKSTCDPESRLLNPALAGGAMYDIGVYPIEIITYLVGEKIKGVWGTCRNNPQTGVDENDTFTLSFDSCDAAVQCLFTASPKEYVILNGEKGTIEIPTASTGDECFLYNDRRELVGRFKEKFPMGNGFVYEVREAVDCISSGKTVSEVMPPEATIECAAVFDAVLKTK